MTRFRARIWKTGSSNVLTVPAAIVGLDFKLGDEVVVEIENPQERTKDGWSGTFPQDLGIAPLPAPAFA